MTIFRRPQTTDKIGQSRNPDEAVQLSENLELCFWSAKRADGTRRMHWALRRINVDDPAQPRRTLRPEDLLECPTVLAAAAESFSAAVDLPKDLRADLATLARKLSAIASAPQANGKDEAHSGPETNRAFSY